MKNIKSWLKIIIFIFIIILIILLDKKYELSNYITNIDNLIRLKESVNNNIFITAIIYILLTVIGCVLLALPGITFAIIAGLFFGPILGTFLCLISTTIGAMLSFIVGRYVLKDAIKPMIEKNQTLKNLLFSGNDKKEIVILMITRLLPIFPYNLQNFAYGITDISFFKYSIYTFIFMLPGVAIFTIGTAGISQEENRLMYIIIALVLLIIIIILGIIIKKRFLKKNNIDKIGGD